MEHSNSKLNSVVGFNANSDGACFEFLFNKLCGNEKQINNAPAPEFDFLSELENTSSLYDNVNNNDLPCFTKKTEESTYTLDDLLDFVSDIPENANFSLDNSFELLSGEPQQPYAEVFADAGVASPLSASSEESCSLDDLLFNEDETPQLLTEELEFPEEAVTEVLDSSNSQFTEAPVPTIEPTEPIQDNTDIKAIALALQENSAIFNQPEFTNDDFSALYSVLLQNQASMDVNNEESNSSFDSSFPSSPAESSPSSPSSSESDSKEDGRYAPYKRSKKQKTPEQRQRKKVQNRNAALRYRVKKKDQFQAINAEADELEDRNRELKGKVDGLRTEIDYLKNLMLDVIKARLSNGTLPENFLALAMES